MSVKISTGCLCVIILPTLCEQKFLSASNHTSGGIDSYIEQCNAACRIEIAMKFGEKKLCQKRIVHRILTFRDDAI